MASLTQWTWVWKNSRCWEWTGRPGGMQSMGLQRVGHDWATELNWTDGSETKSAKVCLKLSIKKTKILASGAIISWQIDGETMETMTDYFFGLQIIADGDCSHEIKKRLLLGRKAMQPRQHIKKQRQYFANKGLSSQSYGFSSSHVWMWELNYKESWAPKNWCFWTVDVGEDSWESLGLQGDPTSSF